jgi:hypothetical protein
VKPSRAPTLSPMANPQDYSSSPSDSPRSASPESPPSEPAVCSFCSGTDDGEMMCRCLTCNLNYHIYCTMPPQARVARNWLCSACKPQDNTQKKRRKSNAQPQNDAQQTKKQKIKGKGNRKSFNSQVPYALIRI